MKSKSNSKHKRRKAHVPTPAERAKVGRMASMGIPQYQIALVQDISEKTLRGKYREELSKGAVEANLRVTETLFQMATSGTNAAASIFWAKTRCGFKASGTWSVDGSGSGRQKAAVVLTETAYVTEVPPAGSVQVTDSDGERIG